MSQPCMRGADDRPLRLGRLPASHNDGTARGSIMQHGFCWGAAKVTRMFANEFRSGTVVVGIQTPREDLQISVSRSGKVRVFGKRGDEWNAPRQPEPVGDRLHADVRREVGNACQ